MHFMTPLITSSCISKFKSMYVTSMTADMFPKPAVREITLRNALCAPKKPDRAPVFCISATMYQNWKFMWRCIRRRQWAIAQGPFQDRKWTPIHLIYKSQSIRELSEHLPGYVPIGRRVASRNASTYRNLRPWYDNLAYRIVHTYWHWCPDLHDYNIFIYFNIFFFNVRLCKSYHLPFVVVRTYSRLSRISRCCRRRVSSNSIVIYATDNRKLKIFRGTYCHRWHWQLNFPRTD